MSTATFSKTEASMTDRFKWSASRLKRLLQCPRQFRYVYIDGLPIVVTAPLRFGGVMHEVICGAHEAQMEKGELPSLSELLPQFDAIWEKVLAQEQPLFKPSHPTPERYVTMGHEMLRVFHALNRDASPPLAVEIAFEMEVEMAAKTQKEKPEEKERESESEKIILRGVIDRLDEVIRDNGEPALVVTDYKSGQKRPTVAEMEQDTQLTVYALAATQLWELPVQRLEIHFLRDGLSLPTQRSQGSLDWLTAQVLPYAVRAVDRGEFPPAPGYWCRWCDFAAQCQEENRQAESNRNATYSEERVR